MHKRTSTLQCLCLLILTALIAAPILVFAQDLPDLAPPILGEFDPAALEDIDPAHVAILPELTDHARAIFQRGQVQDTPRDPRMFSKIGDSMTNSQNFLVAIGTGEYELGEYTDLEDVIAFIREIDPETNAFNRVNYANALGFTTASALDSTWADSGVCEPNESPLACEFRIANPAFALIMFGTNDVMVFDPSLFDYFLRLVILDTINANVVPVMYTFPIRPEEPEKSAQFNQIILAVAADYDLPVINLVAALEPLPNYGVDLNDTLHLTIPNAPGSATTFDENSLSAGYTVRNLVTLQALDILLTELEFIPAEA